MAWPGKSLFYGLLFLLFLLCLPHFGIDVFPALLQLNEYTALLLIATCYKPAPVLNKMKAYWAMEG
jgi:hypothetical protein